MTGSNIGSPIIIGGIGGSGTRVLARIVSELGVDIGRDLNRPNDDMWINLLFFRPTRIPEGQFDTLESVIPGMDLIRRHRVGSAFRMTAQELRYLSSALSDVWKTDNWGKKRLRWCLKRLIKFILPIRRTNKASDVWGWKEPISHFYIRQFLQYFPEARYVHVVRHGLDMALSGNLNQVKHFGSLHDVSTTNPRDALRFWLAANSKALVTMNDYPERTHVLRFEDLCFEPSNTITSLARFLGFRPTAAEIQRLAGYIRTPESIGRYRESSLSVFNKEDLAELPNHGYDV